MVLIETLWNVNSNSNRNANFCVSVLIETLWNVNVDVRAPVNLCFHRINRNIVECKYRSQAVQIGKNMY